MLRHTRWLGKRSGPNEGEVFGWGVGQLHIVNIGFLLIVIRFVLGVAMVQERKNMIAGRSHDCIGTRRYPQIT